MMKRFLKFRYGEKGFTLIELLIVVAILGVLAAVIVPNVQTFLESGKIGAGRAERSTLQVAVDGCMADAGATALPAPGVAGWQGRANVLTITVGIAPDDITYDANDYLRRTPTEGTYSVDEEGVVTCTAYPGVDPVNIPKINT